jgi:GT2 family glycosyltransferase
VKAYVDFACNADGGGLALIGWVFDPEKQVRGFALLQDGANGLLQKRTYFASSIEDGIEGARIVRVARPDVAQAMSSAASSGHHDHGFALVVPRIGGGTKLALEMADGLYATLDFAAMENLSEIEQALRSYWAHSGDALLTALQDAFGDTHTLTALAAGLELDGRPVEPSHRFSACDQAFSLNDRALVLNGWIAEVSSNITKVELSTEESTLDITSRLVHYARPDLFGVYPWSDEHALGFLCVLPDKVAHAKEVTIKIIVGNGRSQVIRAQVQRADWPRLGAFINTHAALAPSLIDLLAKTPELENSASRLQKHVARLQRDMFVARYPHLPTHVERSGTVVAAIDRAYPLGEAGLLMFGWMFIPKTQPRSITVRSEEGAVDVTGEFSTTLRTDVAQHYRPRYPHINEWCGFICRVPMPTRAGDGRSLCFDFGEMGEIWLKVPTEKSDASGLELMKEILGMVPAPDRMRHKLYEVFDNGLGHALEAVNTARPRFSGRVDVRQFGEPVSNPEISVIVPLYGRFDFLRHQLAQFSDDAEFAAVDLIYVVDDPSILSQTLELAARYHPLFKVPFRLAWYGENRGFAGANNIGVSLALSEYLMLLNSDVIPQHAGWLGILKAALDTLPDAGAVGPLLQFGDNSIQHAGMYPRTDAALPGFSLNTHKGMGAAWEGGDAPGEHPMLTAACLMVRTRDYREVGGFDEGYVIGDFEDSDLCLALRKQGKRLWLAPEARLWHLERQSQNLSNAMGQRQMITLFNGWRYSNKIRTGDLCDPMGVEVQQ